MNEISLYSPANLERAEKIADKLAKSTIVPKDYQNNPGNCFIALDIANQVGMPPLAVMQNLDIIQGRPSWSAKFVIASINNSGKYSHLEYEFKELGEKEVEYMETAWVNQQKTKVAKKIKIQDRSCVAYATNKNGKVLKSPAVSIEMAVKEGWFTKDGSKWQTMPEVMLTYRAASFFGRIYAPEVLLGLNTTDEIIDSAPVMEEKEIPAASVSVSRADEVKETLKNMVFPEVVQISELEKLKQDLEKAKTSEEVEAVKQAYSGKFTIKEENAEAKKMYSEKLKNIAMGGVPNAGE